MSKAAEDLFGKNPHQDDGIWNKNSIKTTIFNHYVLPGPGYHKKAITKGHLGHFSKIREEYQELEDAYEQECQLMMILECADLLGAIEAYVATHNLSLKDLQKMQNITKRAFDNGHRK